jgi:hypothetical protein
LAGAEIENCAFGCTLRSSQPGHGWPQRSQLQPAIASVSRSITLVGAMFCNISLAGLVSSFNNRVVFISVPFALQLYGRRWRQDSAPIAFCFAKIALAPSDDISAAMYS